MKTEKAAEVFGKNVLEELQLERKYEKYLLDSTISWLKNDPELLKGFMAVIEGSNSHAKRFLEMSEKIRAGKVKA